jgi:hypothetical protein
MRNGRVPVLIRNAGDRKETREYQPGGVEWRRTEILFHQAAAGGDVIPHKQHPSQ